MAKAKVKDRPVYIMSFLYRNARELILYIKEESIGGLHLCVRVTKYRGIEFVIGCNLRYGIKDEKLHAWSLFVIFVIN